MLSGNGRRFFQRAVRLLRKPQTAKRQGDAFAAALALDVDQFQRAATEVAGDAIRIMETADHAIGRIKRFLLTRQNLDLAAEDGFGLTNEIGTIFRFSGAAVAST